jgi:uncharacterized protein YndB with AHSA1/START domain
MSNRTVRLHRVLRAKPEKVYRAFLEASAMAKWLPPYGFSCKVHHLDTRVGGTFQNVVPQLLKRQRPTLSVASTWNSFE